eukprot:CAMPEP_0114555278 /NCGR_PEP_ID=MMETSP0114-20121206/8664_1 /TAXON_ID=31324 /ORGANISM="Goniomonas sp, Strain m" /LENGTH=341 /DNA_ID=CAMNT_0001740393 /DNA_START=25 /DNA_END=1051 /DNA_ORIENTATION=+
MACDDPKLLGWGSKQGHIVTGGGRLNDLFVPNRDYNHPVDLPHHHKMSGTTWEAFAQWLREGKRSALAVGAWKRPVFVGGWEESSEDDTAVFNLQTPSFFVDLRFPKLRPDYSRRSGFESLSLDELRALSRQHCFAGYCLVERNIATRHHAIDWNYHPDFPRPRPNKWRIEMKADRTSFKEWAFAKDEFGQAVYMERWERLAKGDGYCLALRRRSEPDAILCVVGEHFALARDRPSLPSFPPESGGGCANLVDAAWMQKDHGRMCAMLDMEGSYGLVSGPNAWQIVRSTLPWREGRILIPVGEVQVHFDERGVAETVTWDGQEWAVMECTFPRGDFVAFLA